MNTAPALIDEQPVQHIPGALEQVDADPKLILLGKVDRDDYLGQLSASVKTCENDIATKAGRDRIRSAAQSIRTRKAEIDRTRKSLTEHWRKQTAAVNEVGKDIIGRLDDLIEEVRAPVTAWEKAEEERIAEADGIIADLGSAKTVTYGSTSADVQERLERIRGINLNPEVLGVRLDMASEMQVEAVQSLTETVAALKADEERVAETERLRAEAAAEAERRLREERERIEAAERQAAEKAEAERLARAAEEAAEKARQEAEEQARREIEERERAAQAEIEAANARAAEAERAAAAERERVERLAREAGEREEAEAEAERQREADIAHRQQVIETAADALTALGLTKKLATAVVNEIASGTIPNVRVMF